MIAKGNSLPGILDAVCVLFDELHDGSISSIMLLNPGGESLRMGAAPNLPRSYVEALEGVAFVGPAEASCGTAAFLGAPVFVDDIATNPLWAQKRGLALAHGLRSCWSVPILSGDGKVLGSFGIYSRQVRSPSTAQGNVIGQFAHLCSIAIERINAVNALRRSEEALRISEERYALAVTGSTNGIWDWDIVNDAMFLSERAQCISGLEPGKTVRPGAEWRSMVKIHPDDNVDLLSRGVEGYLAGSETSYDGEWRILHPDGVYRWVRIRAICRRDEQGRPTRLAGSVSDVDKRKRAEEALQASEQRYALAMSASREGLWDWDIPNDVFWASPRLLEMYGFPPGTTFAGRSDFLERFAFHPEDKPKWAEAVAAHFAGTTARFDTEMRMIPGGETRWIHMTGICTRDASGAPVRWTGSVMDVTERKQSEEALRLSEQRYALAMAASGEGHWDWNIVTGEYYVSPRLLELSELPPGTVFGSRQEFVDQLNFHPDDHPRWESAVAEHFAGKTARFEMELRTIRKKAGLRWIHMTGLCLRDAAGAPIRWAGSVIDITDRKRVEDELRARQDMLDLAQKAARAVAFEWRIGPGEGRNRWSPDLEVMYGLEPGAYDGSYEEWKKLVFADDWAAVKAAVKHAHATGEVSAEYRVVHPDGAMRWLQAKGRMLFESDGQPSRIVGFMLDVTERRQVEEEMQRLERQLLQAQRLEALGTLAGGVAHDFNNILSAILGYGEMALRDVPETGRLRRDLSSIMTAGERGRALVERILAFSRSGMTERVAVNVEEVVRESLRLLSATLPPSVRISARLDAGRAAMLGDSTQIHQLLMNLGSNAIQAMPSGGILDVSLEVKHFDLGSLATIGTIGSGDYLVLEVSDSGSGISPEILDRIFDPFFTTKDVGVGTGLGLSLVHGIVTDVGGAIDVASMSGEGSRFTVYLPRAGDAPEAGAVGETVVPRGNRQRVLVIDDEEPLVRLTANALEDLGYVPTGFMSGAKALDSFRADPDRFDAVITDERMPGISGTELIRQIREVRSAIPIVLVTGYLSTAVASGARAAGADEVLRKPLALRELAASMARALQRRGVALAEDEVGQPD
jgi:PAS domain S-box-containing protein